jgi:hypothetical protein
MPTVDFFHSRPILRRQWLFDEFNAQLFQGRRFAECDGALTR